MYHFTEAILKQMPHFHVKPVFCFTPICSFSKFTGWMVTNKGNLVCNAGKDIRIKLKEKKQIERDPENYDICFYGNFDRF